MFGKGVYFADVSAARRCPLIYFARFAQTDYSDDV